MTTSTKNIDVMNFVLKDEYQGGMTDVDIEEFIEVNPLSEQEIEMINNMEVGDTIPFGGGASPVVILKRTQ